MVRTEVPCEWNAQSWLVYTLNWVLKIVISLPFKLSTQNCWLDYPFKLYAHNRIASSLEKPPFFFTLDVYWLLLFALCCALFFLLVVCYMFVIGFLFYIPYHMWNVEFLKCSL